MMNIFRIAWVAVRELVFEKVFYLLLSFVLGSLVLSAMLGQLSYTHRAKLTVDFMLGGIQLSMILLCVFMGIRLFQHELTMGSVSMVLSKPISRTTFLLGKFLGQWIVQCLIIAAMALITLVFCSQFWSEISYLSIFQTTVLMAFEVSVLMAITYFFAVNTGGVTTAIATFAIYGLGHLRGPISIEWGSQGEESIIWQVTQVMVPDLEIFNMRALASYGLTTGWESFAWSGIYALCCVTFFLVLASITFNSKDVLT